MAWNSRTLECQMYLDVDCRELKYTYAPSKEIDAAALRLEHKLRGWTTEEDRVDKVFGLPWVREQMHAACDLYNNTSVENYYIRAYEKGHLCPPNNLRTQKLREFYHKYNKRCKVDELMQDAFAFNVSAIPTDRTQTPEEALELSILSTLSHTSTNTSIKLSAHKHEEALCRDLEAFSPAFALRVAEERPGNCKEIPTSVCAILYDSALCSSSGWSLQVEDGEQKELNYWSSDWSYRNDADVVGVRGGCTFTAWTEVGFQGEKLLLVAGEAERWVVFEQDTTFANFHENIESFQCHCR